jgi:hypothetical protein
VILAHAGEMCRQRPSPEDIHVRAFSARPSRRHWTVPTPRGLGRWHGRCWGRIQTRATPA